MKSIFRCSLSTVQVGSIFRWEARSYGVDENGNGMCNLELQAVGTWKYIVGKSVLRTYEILVYRGPRRFPIVDQKYLNSVFFAPCKTWI